MNGLVTSEVNWFATLAARAGFAVNNMLFYGKAGGAWMDVDYTASRTNAAGAVIAGPVTFGNTRSGWMAGVGAEFGFWNNWSGKLEYNYLDFGTERFLVERNGLVAAPAEKQVRLDRGFHGVPSLQLG